MATCSPPFIPPQRWIRRKAEEAGRAETLVLNSLVIENAGSLLAEGREAEYDRMVGDKLKALLPKMKWWYWRRHPWQRAVENWPEEEKSAALTSPVSGTEAVCAWLEAEVTGNGIISGN